MSSNHKQKYSFFWKKLRTGDSGVRFIPLFAFSFIGKDYRLETEHRFWFWGKFLENSEGSEKHYQQILASFNLFKFFKKGTLKLIRKFYKHTFQSVDE